MYLSLQDDKFKYFSTFFSDFTVKFDDKQLVKAATNLWDRISIHPSFTEHKISNNSVEQKTFSRFLKHQTKNTDQHSAVVIKSK
jgi:tRNA(Leu) C34 or U34 (ribose-2'-O)-methylase TrmL